MLTCSSSERPTMRLTQLRSFHAVARAGGFTGAARLLHISQPTVTTQVRFLEEAYGAELFYRRGRKVALTPLGEQLNRAGAAHLRARGRGGAPAARLGRIAQRQPARRRRRAVPRDRDAGALQPALSGRAGRGARRQLERSARRPARLPHRRRGARAVHGRPALPLRCRTAATRSWCSCIARTASRGAARSASPSSTARA